MTAEERLQLRRNCLRAVERSADALIVQEAKRVLAELDALEKRELSFLERLPAARRIEYAFRRLPASDRERRAIRLLYDHQGAPPDYLSAVWAEIDERTWHRHIGEMCRNRRHLLSAMEPQIPQPPSAEPGDWAERLIEFDEDGAIRPAEARGGDRVHQSRLRRPGAASGFCGRALHDATWRRISRSARYGW